MSYLLHIAVLLAGAEGLRARGSAAAGPKTGDLTNVAYSFEAFVRDFGRKYQAGGGEYERRAAIFQDSLLQIQWKNSHGARSWTAGVHPFMDWTSSERSERLHGYKSPISHLAVQASPLVALQTGAMVTRDERSDGRLYGGAGDSFEADTPAVQEQDQYGKCGSCWAFAAAGAVEARLKKVDSPLVKAESRISVQALLDCVPQHNTCHGGCLGSSPQNAFDFMRDQGVPLEDNIPYDPMHTGKCPTEPYPLDWVRVSLSGWRALPSNEAQPVMRALVNDGPVAVTADAHNWYDYSSGVFDGCDKNAVPNHSVLVKGYGAEGGKKYWTVQNSWGTRWGEAGTIRLLRQDDSSSWCGVDSEKDGIECDGPGHTNVTVCGTCGLLYSPAVPEIGYITLGPGPSAADLGGLESEAAADTETAIAGDEPAATSEASAALPLTSQAIIADAPDVTSEAPAALPSSPSELAAKEPTASEVISAESVEDQANQIGRYFSGTADASDVSNVLPGSPSVSDPLDVVPVESEKLQSDVSNALPGIPSVADPADVVPVESEKPQAQMPSDSVVSVAPPLASVTDSSVLPSGYSATDAVDAYLRR